MRLTIDIDDSRLLDAIGAVNGSNAVTRARAQLKSVLREAAYVRLVESGLVDNIIDTIIEKRHTRGIIGALSK